ncbi:MAG: hypothetical protein H6696_15070 [Deferribacteres bacterium]|nr:hypothetical protein [candidate division KSB1 bacterium]MCB9503250.1 hypothetical protein [Deferribacteres bacterium]
MSEVISGAIAGAATAACVAAAGLVISAARVTYKACTWLSDKVCEEMERLEHALDEPLPEFSTPAEAKQAFQNNLKRIKNLVEASPVLAHQADQVSQLIAFKHSTLSSFVDTESWKKFTSKATPVAFEKLISNSVNNFSRSNAAYLIKSITEVAGDAGFTDVQHKSSKQGRHVLILKDDRGRAVLSHLQEADSGSQIELDLAGFGNNSCHTVMDELLAGLEQKQIRLSGITRKSHYNRKGVLQNLSEPQTSCNHTHADKKKTKKNDERRRRDLATRNRNLQSKG